MSLKIVFMGTPEFSVPTLEALIKNKFSILSVYTQPPKKSKRGQKINPSPIEEFSRKKNLNLRSPNSLNNNDEEFQVLKNLSPDLGIPPTNQYTLFKDLRIFILDEKLVALESFITVRFLLL